MLKSVTIGRETIDTPIELRSGQKLAGVTLVFTDRLTEVNGTITDDRGQPITEHCSRSRPTNNLASAVTADHDDAPRPGMANAEIRGPAGDYSWSRSIPLNKASGSAAYSVHRPSATRFSVTEGDVKTQDQATVAVAGG